VEGEEKSEVQEGVGRSRRAEGQRDEERQMNERKRSRVKAGGD